MFSSSSSSTTTTTTTNKDNNINVIINTTTSSNNDISFVVVPFQFKPCVSLHVKLVETYQFHQEFRAACEDELKHIKQTTKPSNNYVVNKYTTHT